MTVDDDDQKGYTWEAGYADGLNIREVLEEDEGGSIEKSIAKLVAETRKKQRTLEKPAKIRLGIMRYVYVAIDCSRSMTSKVMPPSRFFVTMKILSNFLDKFFEQNPIAQIGLILVKDKKAERFVSLTDPKRTQHQMLGHWSKCGTLRMQAVGENYEWYAALPKDLTTTSAISFEGRYDVVLDADHMEMLLAQHTAPPPSTKAAECNAIRVAFPPHINIKERSFCVWECMACERPLAGEGFACKSCGAIFCFDCDILLHESLHVCPNCV
ncbi:TFIIH C1-like domain protein [Ancylostoma ceylanicum]|uniref:TFIIH C1-like domain protein n=1 Tax=Ancylostoma ceylanicum TaxID=53326 RepID=A0A0D6LRH1_9BILA|nr:TFIIH C1-like domain protein [Ancylostoma ceylanicum]